MKLALALLLVATTARADHPPYTQFSAPLILGGSSAGFVAGFRPEVVVAGNAPRGGIGLGGYAELLRIGGNVTVGTGITTARYTRRGFAIAPSFGVYGGASRGISTGVFVGLRRPNEYHVEMPIGVRLDGHFHDDGGSDVILAAHIDLVPVGVLGAALWMGLHPHD
jgi:hypothetical protein